MASRTEGTGQRLTGDRGIWIFVFIDMMLFALIFAVFMVERGAGSDTYRTSQSHLDIRLALLNTIVLLTSSLYFANAVAEAKNGNHPGARRNLTAVLFLGLFFCILKMFEYEAKFASGFSVVSDSFFTFYFFITFLHLLHVIAGMLFIIGCIRAHARSALSTHNLVAVEGLGLFWHYVDLLWIYIVAMLYLMP